MAKRNSTSKIARARKSGPNRARNPARSARSANRPSNTSPEGNAFEDFGSERTALMQAEAVLSCLTVALNYSGWSGEDGTTHAMAVDVARALVQQSMDRLEQRDREIETGKRRPN